MAPGRWPASYARSPSPGRPRYQRQSTMRSAGSSSAAAKAATDTSGPATHRRHPRSAHRSGVSPIGDASKRPGLAPGWSESPRHPVAVPRRPRPRATVVVLGVGPAVGWLIGRARRRVVTGVVERRQLRLRHAQTAEQTFDLVQPLVHVALLGIRVGGERPPVVGRDRREARPRTSRRTDPASSPSRTAGPRDRTATGHRRSRSARPSRRYRSARAGPRAVRPTSGRRRSTTAMSAVGGPRRCRTGPAWPARSSNRAPSRATGPRPARPLPARRASSPVGRGGGTGPTRSVRRAPDRSARPCASAGSTGELSRSQGIAC